MLRPPRTRRLALLLGVLLLGGCIYVPSDRDSTAPVPVASTTQAERPRPEPTSAPATRTSAAPPERDAPPPRQTPPKVAILVSASAEDNAVLVEDLEEQLVASGFATQRVTLANEHELQELETEASEVFCIVAIGTEAARLAMSGPQLPTVVGQVPESNERFPGAYSVAMTPPLDMQLAAWQQLDPSLHRVALILSQGDGALATEASRAAVAAGIELDLRTASTDREAVYLFRRMAENVDGLWLLPDNAILSPRSVREMLSLAAARRVESLVFTPALLDWGALISVSSTAQDIAATIANVVVLLDEKAATIPAMTPLSKTRIHINLEAADRLGLVPPAETWVLAGGPAQ